MNNIRVNGESCKVPGGWRVSDLLLDLGHIGGRIAVERNGEIVPRSDYEQVSLQANDNIEIVSAIGGG
ncbi:MAG: sulfur carrier protein ThiS [Candidatus Thiodiazotropha sp.]